MKPLSEYDKRQLRILIIFLVFLLIHFLYSDLIEIKSLIFIFVVLVVLTRVNKKSC